MTPHANDFVARKFAYVQRALEGARSARPLAPATPEEGLARIQATSDRRERAFYAFEVAHAMRNQKLTHPVVQALVPILFEVLETSDDLTPVDGLRAATKLFELGLRTDQLRAAIQRRVARARQDLALIQDVAAQLPPGSNEQLLVSSGGNDNQRVAAELESLLAENWTPPAAEAPVAAPQIVAPPPSGNRWLAAPIVLGVVAIVGFTVVRSNPSLLAAVTGRGSAPQEATVTSAVEPAGAAPPQPSASTSSAAKAAPPAAKAVVKKPK